MGVPGLEIIHAFESRDIYDHTTREDATLDRQHRVLRATFSGYLIDGNIIVSLALITCVAQRVQMGLPHSVKGNVVVVHMKPAAGGHHRVHERAFVVRRLLGEDVVGHRN